jgi:hypothetical protein
LRATTNVGRGENSGRTLSEFNIVRQFRSLGVWNGQESVFHAPLDSFPGDATRVAVLLQRAQQGLIVGSATALYAFSLISVLVLTIIAAGFLLGL